jgi:preprotein translocase subunit SecD
MMRWKNLIYAVFIAVLPVEASFADTAPSAVEAAPQELPRFVLAIDEIAEWTVAGGTTLYLKMTDAAAERLKTFTTENLNKQIDFYIADVPVSRPVVQVPISSHTASAFLTPDLHEALLPKLPVERETVVGEE